MNRRLLGVFGFALAVASLTSFIVYRLIASHTQHAVVVNAPPPNTILVAARDLQVGAMIHDVDIREAPWAGPVPEHAAKTKAEIVGRGVVSPVYEREPFFDQRLAQKGAGAGLASTIPVGKRAVALRVNDVVGLAGFVLPGMRVDVLIAGSLPGEADGNGTRCRTLLQNIEVLSTGQHIEKSPEGKPESAEVVNLLVTPDQAETLNLASSETKIQLVLRNPVDTDEAVTHGSSVAELFGVKGVRRPAMVALAPAPAVPGPRPQQTAAVELPTVEVFSGTKKAQQSLDMNLRGRQ